MAFNITDIFKEHKKVLLSTLGIILVVLILAVVAGGNQSVFTLSDNITGGGVDNLVNDSKDMKNKNEGYSEAPKMALKSGVDYSAVLYTSYGEITLDLYENDTPMTVNNFVFLSKEKFYDGLTFHRVAKNFVIQGGDPLGTGTGGPGYTFGDEIDASKIGLSELKVADATYLRSFYNATVLDENKDLSVAEFYEKYLGYEYTNGKGTHTFAPYVVAMANSGPASNGSQFFITVKTFTGEYLNGKHTIFGEVTSGHAIVDAIEAVNIGADGVPTTPVKINKIEIIEK